MAVTRFQSDEFIIKHFAGEVTYSVGGFLEKNNDSLHDNLLSLLSESEHPFLRNLFSGKSTPGEPGYIKPVANKDSGKKAPTLDLEGNIVGGGGGGGRDNNGGRGRRPKDHSERLGKGAGTAGGGPGSICGAFTVSGTFRKQLDDLTSTLKQTEPHYIKCIKPNNIKAAGGFSSRLVVQQLRYSGVLEVVRIRREAYPTRILFQEFYKRFDVLLGPCKPKKVETANDYRTACKAIVSRVLPPDGFQLGKRKIFLRDNGLDMLRAAIRDYFAGHAARIQAQVRAWIGHRWYKRTLRRIKVVQKLIRMHLLRKRYLRYRRQLVVVQSWWRCYCKSRDYGKMRWVTIRLQAHARRRIAMKRFSRKSREAKLRVETAATRIVACYRAFRTWVWYKKYKAATRVAACYRGYKARTSYIEYRAATEIAAQFRGYKARKHYVEYRAATTSAARYRGYRAWTNRKRYLAATRVAAMYRGYKARQHYRILCAVARIVATFRGCVARKRFQKAQLSILTLQLAWRCYVAHCEARTLRACVRIQSAWRAYKARERFCSLKTQARLRREKEEKMAACLIQSTWKAIKTRRQMALWRAMATRIQTQYRRARAIKQRDVAMRSILLIQTTVRRYQCQVLLRRLRAAIRIQTFFRCQSQRYKYRQEISAIHIQTFWRSRHQRRLYLRLRSAIKIQAFYRGRHQHWQYRQIKSAILIQSMVRRFIARNQYLQERSAIKIQAQVRRSLARRTYCRLKAIILIQRIWRGKLVHYVYVYIRSALRIQKRMRGWVRRAQYKRKMKAVLTLQSAARHFLHSVCIDQRVKRLHEAARSGMVHVVAKILEDRPGLSTLRNRKDMFKTLLHSAAMSDEASVVAYLNCQYPDLRVEDSVGNTPLHYAAGRGNYAITKMFARLCDSPQEPSAQLPKGAAAASQRKACFSISSVTSDTLDARRRAMKHKTEGRIASPPKPSRRGTLLDSKDLRGVALNDPQQAAAALTRLKVGYLRKRRETDRFQRRWCILTDKELKYYHSPQDRCASKVIQLRQAMLKMCDHTDFCFEIHSPLLLDNRNREGRLYFQAENEMELQAWFCKLRLVVGQISHMYGKRAGSIGYINMQRREALVTHVNHHGETPLHAVAKLGDSCRGAAQVVTWLVENGADINAQDENGNTPMHVAVANGHKKLSTVLAKKGANLSLRNSMNTSVLELMKDSKELVALTKAGVPEAADHFPLLLPPEKLPGCSYMSFMVEKLAMTGMDQLKSPSLSISVWSTKRHMVEARQDVIYPAVMRNNFIWWGWTWHMQTPVENMAPGSIAVVELRDRRLSTKTGQLENMVLAWAVIHLDDNVVDSNNVNLEMYRAPVDLKLQRMEPADFFVGGEICVSRLESVLE